MDLPREFDQRTIAQNRLVIHTMPSICQEMEILEKMDPMHESEDRIIVRLIQKYDIVGAPSELHPFRSESVRCRVVHGDASAIHEISTVGMRK